jgi:hypothetical protein
MYGSGSESFYHQAKLVRKTFIPPVCDFFMILSLKKNDVNAASRVLNKKII